MNKYYSKLDIDYMNKYYYGNKITIDQIKDALSVERGEKTGKTFRRDAGNCTEEGMKNGTILRIKRNKHSSYYTSEDHVHTGVKGEYRSYDEAHWLTKEEYEKEVRIEPNFPHWIRKESLICTYFDIDGNILPDGNDTLQSFYKKDYEIRPYNYRKIRVYKKSGLPYKSEKDLNRYINFDCNFGILVILSIILGFIFKDGWQFLFYSIPRSIYGIYRKNNIESYLESKDCPEKSFYIEEKGVKKQIVWRW